MIIILITIIMIGSLHRWLPCERNNWIYSSLHRTYVYRSIKYFTFHWIGKKQLKIREIKNFNINFRPKKDLVLLKCIKKRVKNTYYESNLSLQIKTEICGSQKSLFNHSAPIRVAIRFRNRNCIDAVHRIFFLTEILRLSFKLLIITNPRFSLNFDILSKFNWPVVFSCKSMPSLFDFFIGHRMSDVCVLQL